MNTITLLGRTTSAIELKQSKAGKSVATFSLAVKRPYTKDVADFFNICAWGTTAELLAKYVNKGNQVCIRGYLTNREWQDKQGNKRISTEIIAEEISFVGGKESSTEAKNEPSAQPYVPTPYSTQNSQNFEDIDNPEGLPF
jgi:single-strand DNA-binding protein